MGEGVLDQPQHHFGVAFAADQQVGHIDVGLL